MIPYGRQQLTEQDIQAVENVLRSDWLTQGPVVPKFEQAVAKTVQAQYAVAVNSATSALHIACLALNVGPNDSVWTSPITFVASANCALYCGATVDFVDIELATGNMSVDALSEKLAKAKQKNKLPKVVIPVHLGGQPCDMAAIYQLSKIYGFAIIEDAAHAIGAQYQKKPVGCCQYSDITIFSFHPVKIITTAEGGMALTNDKKLAEKLSLYRSHGIVSDEERLTEPSHGPWYYQQIALGFNYRMTDIHAALGLSQLTQLPEFIQQRNRLAANYDAVFSKQKAITPLTQSIGQLSAYHLYIIRLTQPNKAKHKQMIERLRDLDICAHVHYIPVHLQPYYQQLGFNFGDFPNAEAYYDSAVTLPLFPSLSAQDQQFVIDSVLSLL